ncbi:hypothetical protein ACWGDT_39485 [Streptomyces avermitilis]
MPMQQCAVAPSAGPAPERASAGARERRPILVTADFRRALTSADED